ncbi:MAG TPA: thioredoxin domain-containing protein, partial [Kofleriaceae bacterium]|nr:thioredoxin domain-containing protein [Kofleriaceae bacterium]
LAVRRMRCEDVARDRRRGLDDDDEAEQRATPRAGWHLGTLLRDGTGCPPEPTPTGRVDQAFDYELGRRVPRAALLAAPLSGHDLPGCGPANAPVVIQVVCSLRTSSCGDQLELARRVAKAYFPSVRVVYRPWIDDDDDGERADRTLAQAAMCGQRLGDGWRFVMQLRALAREAPDLHVPVRHAGLEAAAFDVCVAGSDELTRHAIDEARAAGVVWTPTVIVGQRAYIGGLTDARPLEDLVDAELAPGLLGGTSDAASFAAGEAPAAGLANTCDDEHD